MPNGAPYTEPIAVPDVFVTDLARIERLRGGYMRFTFYAEQESIHDRTTERVIVARIVMSAEVVIEAAMAARMAVEGVEGAVGDIMVSRKH